MDIQIAIDINRQIRRQLYILTDKQITIEIDRQINRQLQILIQINPNTGRARRRKQLYSYLSLCCAVHFQFHLLQPKAITPAQFMQLVPSLRNYPRLRKWSEIQPFFPPSCIRRFDMYILIINHNSILGESPVFCHSSLFYSSNFLYLFIIHLLIH